MHYSFFIIIGFPQCPKHASLRTKIKSYFCTKKRNMCSFTKPLLHIAQLAHALGTGQHTWAGFHKTNNLIHLNKKNISLYITKENLSGKSNGLYNETALKKHHSDSYTCRDMQKTRERRGTRDT